MSNELITIQNNLTQLINAQSKGLPRDLNRERFIQNTIEALKDVKDLHKMKPESVALTVMKGAYLGLDFFMKECYAIPYGNSVSFQTDYKGEVKLLKKYSINPVLEIYAKVVKTGDSLTTGVENGKPYLSFKDNPFSDGEIIGCFAVCQFKDDSFIYETMSKKDVEYVRDNYSKMPNGKAWKNFGEMAKKTVIRRLRKSIHIDFETLEQAKEFEESGDCEFKEIKNITPEIKKPQMKKPETTIKIISEPQRKRMFAIQKESGLTPEQCKPILKEYGYESSKDIQVKDYEDIIKEIEETGKFKKEYEK